MRRAARGWHPIEGRPLDLVVFAEPCAWRRQCLDLLDRSGVAYRITFTSASVDAVMGAVSEAFGWPSCRSSAPTIA